jgi:AhpD family alkylhydroperoxidase
MTTDYARQRTDLERGLAQLGQEIPGPMSGFARLHRKATDGGALDSSFKEMMALAISIVVGCEGCIAYHAHDAIKAGASRDELLEAISVAILMGGGPASIYATHALEAVDQLLLLPAEP